MSAIHVCSFTQATGTGEVNGRKYYWDFSERFGPLFTDKDGEPLDRQPGIRSNAWRAFDAWHKELLKETGLMHEIDCCERLAEFAKRGKL